jgi:heterodisulfide reductase subunit C
MDLTVGELMQAAARDSEGALACRTLWSESLSRLPPRCQQGLNVVAVIEALRAEAVRRGLGRTPE